MKVRGRGCTRTFQLLFIFALLILSALQYYRDSFATSHFQDILQNMLTPEHESVKLFFESEESYRARLMIEEKILFGSKIKSADEVFFNSREGYREAYLDSLPILRTDLPQFRPEGCAKEDYRRSKTTISVVMNYHNELLSLLLRSVYTVIREIPRQNLHEVILIDDASNLTQHHDLHYVQELMEALLVPVKFHRFESNMGLIYSRRFGCQQATGDAVLVLDSHVEVQAGFIEPLLRQIDSNYKTIAAPTFDFWDTFQNKYWSYDNAKLGFDHYLTWITVKHEPGASPHAPYRTPAIMGGAFLATKRWLAELDYFGRGMLGWGYENIEIGMKTWMCGGSLLYVPCSRVLHYAAKRSPMTHGNRARPDHYLHNAGLVVKSYFSEDLYTDFDRDNGVEKDVVKYGDTISANRDMLKMNNCTRDYGWMRSNLMPGIESYDELTTIARTVVSSTGPCVHMRKVEERQEFYLSTCNPNQSLKNTMRLTKKGELRILDRQCLDWGYKQLRFSGCHGSGGNQITKYDEKRKRLTSFSTSFCLVLYTATGLLDKGPCEEIGADNSAVEFPQFTFQTVFHPDLLNSVKDVVNENFN